MSVHYVYDCSFLTIVFASVYVIPTTAQFCGLSLLQVASNKVESAQSKISSAYKMDRF